jgi:hypothetical protein
VGVLDGCVDGAAVGLPLGCEEGLGVVDSDVGESDG